MITDRRDDATTPSNSALFARWGDLAAAALGTFAAAAAFLVLPEGSTLRLMLSLPILFLIPGYALIQALRINGDRPGARPFHALFSLALSPALVGLMALAAVVAPGGFRAGTIVAVVVLGCLALIGVAAWRRFSVPTPDAPDVAATNMPESTSQ